MKKLFSVFAILILITISSHAQEYYWLEWNRVWGHRIAGKEYYAQFECNWIPGLTLLTQRTGMCSFSKDGHDRFICSIEKPSDNIYIKSFLDLFNKDAPVQTNKKDCKSFHQYESIYLQQQKFPKGVIFF
jgi:hypothetical protein